jgi:hypothetical protein
MFDPAHFYQHLAGGIPFIGLGFFLFGRDSGKKWARILASGFSWAADLSFSVRLIC